MLPIRRDMTIYPCIELILCPHLSVPIITDVSVTKGHGQHLTFPPRNTDPVSEIPMGAYDKISRNVTVESLDVEP